MFHATARPAPQLAHSGLPIQPWLSAPATPLEPSIAVAIFAVLAAAMLLAMLSDPALSYLLQTYDLPRLLAHDSPLPLRIVRAPGEFITYLPVLALLCLVPRWRWRGSLLLASASASAALATTLLKWAVGRYRPFCDGLPNPHPFDFRLFAGGLHGLVHSPANLCFPSGHTSLAFAAATSLGMVFPQHRWSFWAIAATTGLSRIAQGAHYTSDVLAGAAVGIAAAILSRHAVALLCTRLRQRSGRVVADDAKGITQPLQ